MLWVAGSARHSPADTHQTGIWFRTQVVFDKDAPARALWEGVRTAGVHGLSTPSHRGLSNRRGYVVALLAASHYGKGGNAVKRGQADERTRHGHGQMFL